LRFGNQTFRYIGDADFDRAGQVRCEFGRIQGDTDGDGRADFEIALSGVYGTLSESHFIL
jgi:hypothetical protein